MPSGESCAMTTPRRVLRSPSDWNDIRGLSEPDDELDASEYEKPYRNGTT